MANIAPINNFETLELLMAQFKDLDFFGGIMEAMTEQFDDLETSLFEIQDNIYLDVAEGVQLDMIGEIVNVLRNGATDNDYREAIRNEFEILFSSGEPEAVINIVKTLYGGTFAHYFQGHLSGEIASYIVVTDAIITQSQMENFSPAGVQPFRGEYLIESAPSDEYIVFNNDEKIIITS